jgi:hypothetical protein
VWKMAAYPSNIAIIQRSCLPNLRTAGISDLRGTDLIWAGAIIADQSQVQRYRYPGR